MKPAFLALALLLSSFTAYAEEEVSELNPFDPEVEQQLLDFDAAYEAQTGLSSHLEEPMNIFSLVGGCQRQQCAVWARVSKARQTLYLYVNGRLQDSWPISSGLPGHETPRFDKHPDGRIYDRYTSGKYPGGDYNGLGNMPYAVFIKGGFALHGTPSSNWSKLGRKASHGCIRMHPDNGYRFNRLVRANGIANVWITVE